jgi:hypothetical protein
MKTIRGAVLFFALFLTISCAALTRQNAVVERDEFLNKLPMLNNEILGEMKYDSPNLDLRELGIESYPELFDRVDPTEDYKKVIYFIRDHASEGKLIVQRDTFVICLHFLNYMFIICDDASTALVDKIHIGESIPALDGFCTDFLEEAGLKESRD